MSKQLSLTYVFIGDFNSNKIVTEYCLKSNPTTQKEFIKIFERLSKLQDKKIDQRNKIQGIDTNYYFTTTTNQFFVLVEANKEYPEFRIFELIKEISDDNLTLMQNDKGELNLVGKDRLKELVEKYQQTSKIDSLQGDLREIKVEMKDTINKQLNNLERVDSLQLKSDSLAVNAKIFRDDAVELKRVAWWNNFKLTLIITLLIVGVILAIVLPIALKGNSNNNSNNSNNNTQPNTNPRASNLLFL